MSGSRVEMKILICRFLKKVTLRRMKMIQKSVTSKILFSIFAPPPLPGHIYLCSVVPRIYMINYYIQDVAKYCAETKYVDLDARDHAGYTAMHECCSQGHLAVASYLIGGGASVNLQSCDGMR